jgi:carnitine 3-dehydrogenase
MFHAKSGDLLATTEQMLVHVDMNKGEACQIEPAVEDILRKIWVYHQKLPVPKQKGRVMAIKK